MAVIFGGRLSLFEFEFIVSVLSDGWPACSLPSYHIISQQHHGDEKQTTKAGQRGRRQRRG